MSAFGTRPSALQLSRASTAPSVPADYPPFLFSPPILPAPSRSSSSSSGLSSRSLRRNVLIRDLGIGNLIVPKGRRAKFDLTLHIHDLNNIPLVSGYAYIKWYIEGSTRADCRSRTTREPIKDHKVVWRYTHDVQGLRLNIGRGNVLQEQHIVLEVHQEYSGGRERIQLGTVRLNLAEYARRACETRRYLMQDSKINSTLKVGIEMHQVGGESSYEVPALKGAQVFAGIAGIIGDQRDSDESRNIPIINSKNRETGATQDMYRRTLAASWQLIPGELNADECIEDIFAGGDGWSGSARDKKPKSVRLFDSGRSAGSDSDSTSQLSVPGSTPTTMSIPESKTPLGPSLLTVEPIRDGKKKGYAVSVMTARSKLSSNSSMSRQKELDELDARDDLVSWRMPGPGIIR
ncbi:N-terminal C2 in EEIG1 and EHBP1 proteins-domain-containing protein [Sphaerosporella brunnea]|uniref:N-terminal C2 in EEIG1 and EHBP1 proteins-domain-containing protein n=1 Tax=Sphaerosporella brunnea TaxID=1250544 RepID=A0A5J5F6Z0_9PEZI|nr:N-terminal C2 in EEIG1 and EHBP1 proteins-domain-containing protein [Sphaerosporella brunnea]